MIILNFLVIFIIALSLSMDAFSLSLAYGTLNLEKKNIYELSIIVGIYHFIMPILGCFCGNKLLKFLPMNSDLLVFLVLSIIGIEMIIETFKGQDKVKIMKNLELIIFGFAVSVDSFSVGIGLSSITNNIYLSSLVFSIVSMSLTYVGLILGKKISNITGKLSTIIGGFILVVIGLFYLV